MIFCHVEGEEEYLTVSTEEGNEQSCSNKQEVNQVVCTLQSMWDLLQKKHIKHKFIIYVFSF